MSNTKYKFIFPIFFMFFALSVSFMTIYAEDQDTEADVLDEQQQTASETIEEEFNVRVEEYQENNTTRYKLYDDGSSYRVFNFLYIDNTDPDNEVTLYQHALSQVSSSNGTILNAIHDDLSLYHPIAIEGYMFDRSTTNSDLNYAWPYFTTDEYGTHMVRDQKIYYFKNTGKYLLTNDKLEQTYYIDRSTITGKNDTYEYDSIFHLNDTIVWCIEPDVSTWPGIRYDAYEGEQNILATIASMYGYGYQGDTSTLAALVTQVSIWNSVGYGSIYDPIYVYLDSSKTEAISDEDQIKLDEIRARILRAYEVYTSGETLNLQVVDGQASFEDGKLILESDTVVLKTENVELLKYYLEGQILWPDDVEGNIDVENGTITLTVDRSTYTSGALSFTMIPEEFQTQPVLFKANSIKQKLMSFGLLNPNVESYTFSFKEVPEQPEKPEEPETPEEPEQPKEEKEENNEQIEEKNEEPVKNTAIVQTSTETNTMFWSIVCLSACTLAYFTIKKFRSE